MHFYFIFLIRFPLLLFEVDLIRSDTAELESYTEQALSVFLDFVFVCV
jgi:hypothetical protein